MKHDPIPEHERAGKPHAASVSTSAPAAFGDSPRQRQQGEHLAQLQRTAPAAGVVQRKGRVALDKIEGAEKRAALSREIAEARDARIAAKQEARVAWLAQPDGTKDDEYNAAMEKARGHYGNVLWNIKLREGLTAEQFPTGSDYYGPSSGGVSKRPDNGKEYVADANGVFAPRHVRRELNKFDLPKVEGDGGLAPTGLGTHQKGYGDHKVSGRKGQAFNAADREFLQQSVGGGANQFAFSHAATHYPILSNDHLNFGKPSAKHPESDAHGRIVTDLSQIAQGERHAQWALAPEDQGGHKIRRNETDFAADWMHRRRDKVVTSGYRNMEVITGTVPKASIVDTQLGWEADDASGKGLSPAGERFRELRRQKEKKVEAEAIAEEAKEDKPREDDLGS